jgi:hypothetical protein
MMTRLRLRLGTFSFNLDIPTEIGKFLICGAVVLLFLAAAFASHGVSTSTSVGHDGITVTAGRPSPNEYAEVIPGPTDRIPTPPKVTERDLGFYVIRRRIIGDYDPSEGRFFYTYPKCTDHPKDKRAAEICAMPQGERLKHPIDKVDDGQKKSRRHSLRPKSEAAG